MRPVRDPQMYHTTPLQTRKWINTTRIGINLARASYLAVRGPHGTLTVPARLFTGCLQSQNPYGARKLIIHASKLYGPRTGRQNLYGAARGPSVFCEWTYHFCSKQAVNSPYGDRECDVTGALGFDRIIRRIPHEPRVMPLRARVAYARELYSTLTDT